MRRAKHVKGAYIDVISISFNLSFLNFQPYAILLTILVAEVFFLGKNEKYLEVELSP